MKQYWLTDEPNDVDEKFVSITPRKLPPPAVRARVKHLVVHCFGPLPRAIAEFPAVEVLVLEGAHVRSLTPDLVPKKLRLLCIVSDETTKYTLHPDITMPHLRELSGFCRLAFRASQIPRTSRIEIKLASPKMIDELRALPIRWLGVGPLADASLLRALAPLDLEKLAIMGGNARTLAGVELFPNLRVLRVKRLTQLRDVSAIAKLKKLEQVELEWCPRLSKIDALTKLPKLRTVDLWASNVRGASGKKVLDAFRRKKITISNAPGDDD